LTQSIFSILGWFLYNRFSSPVWVAASSASGFRLRLEHPRSSIWKLCLAVKSF